MPKAKASNKEAKKNGPKKMNKQTIENENDVENGPKKETKKEAKKETKKETTKKEITKKEIIKKETTKKVVEKPKPEKHVKIDNKKQTEAPIIDTKAPTTKSVIKRADKSIVQPDQKELPSTKKEISLLAELSEFSDYTPDSEFEDEDEFGEEFMKEILTTEVEKSDDVTPFFEEEEEFEEPGSGDSSIESTESRKISPKAKYYEYRRQLANERAEKKKKDFFEQFQRIPDIDVISLDRSTVDEPLGSVTSHGEEEFEPEVSEEGSEEATQRRYSDRSISEFSFESYSLEEDEVEYGVVDIKKVDNNELFEMLVTMANPPVVAIKEIDLEELARLNELRQLQQDTENFLKELIDCVVEHAEYVDPKDFMRENLDKVKLFRDLVRKLQHFNADRKINNFLENRCYEYCRRQKKMRDLRPDPPEHLEHEMEKFEEATEALNRELGREAAMEAVIAKAVYQVEVKEIAKEKQLKKELAALESRIRKTFQDRGSEHFMHFVDKRIHEMAKFRKDFSKMRRILIGHLHTKGRLVEKIEELERIGDDNNLREYEILKDETDVLEKKLEERTYELERAQSAFSGKINILAHMHDRQTLMTHTILVQRMGLDETTKKKDELRYKIHQLKISRVSVKKQIRQLSFHCGLIDKPNLCLDYDATVDRSKILKRNVDSLKAEVHRMQHRIKIVCKKLKHPAATS